MEAQAIADNSNTRGWILDKNNRRSLDVFYTDYGTKLFVEDGTLIEEKISRPSTEIHSIDGEHAGLSDYSCSSPPGSPGPTAEKEMDQSQTIRSAKVALKYYNNKRGTHYELVKPVLSHGCIWRSGLWIHANFTACDGDSSAKLFFAEVKVAGGSKYAVTACRPLHGKIIF
ncbi:hypothetical protein KSS87_020461 [Heliosperma pusillum]|nr:hypothetical protein KSS87_020461 [Heliosperma pusillum]